MEINLVEFRSADKEYVWLRYVDSMQSYIQKTKPIELGQPL